jgi:hypothetical protein
MQLDEPLLMLISHDRDLILLSSIDESLEHHILLKQLNYNEADIDKFYRVVINQEGADWTFVCPISYRDIENREKRIEAFYNDGITAITEGINAIGYDCKIDIPRRYRRHLDIFKE